MTNKITIMATWYPRAMSYRQWLQTEGYKDEITSTFNKQTNRILANQKQIRQIVSDRLDKIASINNAGFEKVINTIESLHSDFNHLTGFVIQELEIQSDLLQNILYTL